MPTPHFNTYYRYDDLSSLYPYTNQISKPRMTSLPVLA